MIKKLILSALLLLLTFPHLVAKELYSAVLFPANRLLEADNAGDKYIKFDEKSGVIHAKLEPKITKSFTVNIKFLVASYPNNGVEAFSETSPAGIFILRGGKNDGEVIFRVFGKKLQAYLRGNTPSGKAVTSEFEIPVNQWVLATIVCDNLDLSLYVNGKFASKTKLNSESGSYDWLVVGQDISPSRKFFGNIAIFSVFDEALSANEIGQLFVASKIDKNLETKVITPPLELKYPALKVADNVVHPIAGSIGRTAEIVPWGGTDSKDLLVSGIHSFFGHRVMLYRNLRMENNKFVVERGESLPLRGRDFRVLKKADGGFDLLASGAGTSIGDNNLAFFKNIGEIGKPKFDSPTAVKVDKLPFFELFTDKSISHWNLGDINNDGVEDLIFSVVAHGDWSKNCPDGMSFWNNQYADNMGPNRGYDIENCWLGEESRYFIYYALGIPSSPIPEFGKVEKIYLGKEKFPLQWKTYPPGPAPAIFTSGSKKYLALSGNANRLFALELNDINGNIHCDKPFSLTENGITEMTYWNESMRTCDIDNDNKDELVLAGNPGRIVVLKEGKNGQFDEFSINEIGGYVETDTLCIVSRGIWDDDQYPDLITGDASGYLIYWPGTEDPLVYQTPVHLKSNGKIVKHQAGDSGSIQGYHERIWGYLQPTIGDWDNDGKNEIITNDIKGELVLYSRGKSVDEVEPKNFTYQGGILPAAWRVRPAILPAEYNFDNRNMPVLLFLDYEGDLAVAIPDKVGSTVISEIIKLTNNAGLPIKMSGIKGHWGRAKLSVADFNNDGNFDIVWGHNYAVYRDIWPKNKTKPQGATVAIFENKNNNISPKFDETALITQKDGTLLNFRNHNSAVFPTSLNSKKQNDLIVGAEDGKVYYFFHNELMIKEL